VGVDSENSIVRAESTVLQVKQRVGRQNDLGHLPGVAAGKTQHRRSNPVRGDRGQEHTRRRRVLLQIFLYDKSAHRVTDDHGRKRKRLGDGTKIIDVVGDRTRMEESGQAAGAVTAKAHGGNAITMLGEVVKEMFSPAPSAMPSTMNKQQHHRLRLTQGLTLEDFQSMVPPRCPRPA
jgi:hypothetical protein